MDYNRKIFPDTFKIVVNTDNFEFIQRILFMGGMQWAFDGQNIKPYNTNLEFSFLYIGRLHQNIIQIYHHRSIFDELDIPELIIKWD